MLEFPFECRQQFTKPTCDGIIETFYPEIALLYPSISKDMFRDFVETSGFAEVIMQFFNDFMSLDKFREMISRNIPIHGQMVSSMIDYLSKTLADGKNFDQIMQNVSMFFHNPSDTYNTKTYMSGENIFYKIAVLPSVIATKTILIDQ